MSKDKGKKASSSKLKVGLDKEKFILEKVVEKLEGNKKSLDKLILWYGVFVIVGFVTFFEFGESVKIPFFGFDIDLENRYIIHSILALILLVSFGLIGQHLIDFIQKRHLFRKYSREYLTPVDSEQEIEYNKVFIPTSFYNFLYQIDERKDALRLLAVYVGIGFLAVGHLISIAHIFIGFNEKIYLSLPACAVFIFIYYHLYKTFIASMPDDTEGVETTGVNDPQYRPKPLRGIVKGIIQWVMWPAVVISILGIAAYILVQFS